MSPRRCYTPPWANARARGLSPQPRPPPRWQPTRHPLLLAPPAGSPQGIPSFSRAPRTPPLKSHPPLTRPAHHLRHWRSPEPSFSPRGFRIDVSPYHPYHNIAPLTHTTTSPPHTYHPHHNIAPPSPIPPISQHRPQVSPADFELLARQVKKGRGGLLQWTHFLAVYSTAAGPHALQVRPI